MRKLILLFFVLCHLSVISQKLVSIEGQTDTIYPFQPAEANFQSAFKALNVTLKNKTIIGMGDATHGTHDFFLTKVKFFQYLVTEHQYRVFGIETQSGECAYINDFVSSGKGSIDSAIHYLSDWTARTEEVKELIEWIRMYNVNPENSEKISFYGFDMQNYYIPLQYINNRFKQDTVLSEELNKICKPVLSKPSSKVFQMVWQKNEAFFDTLKQTHASLNNWLIHHKDYIQQNYSNLTIEKVSLLITNYAQGIAMNRSSNISNYRDSCMAENVCAIQSIEGKKLFIWAHNGHINNAYNKMDQILGIPMGGYIKKRIGSQYQSIGFVFNEGSFNAVKGPNSIADAFIKYLFAKKKLYKGLQTCTVKTNKRNTLSKALFLKEYPSYYISCNTSKNKVFHEEKRAYDIGGIFINERQNSILIHAAKQFDGLIFINKTGPTNVIKIN